MRLFSSFARSMVKCSSSEFVGFTINSSPVVAAFDFLTTAFGFLANSDYKKETETGLSRLTFLYFANLSHSGGLASIASHLRKE